jgi:hypothetical protein
MSLCRLPLVLAIALASSSAFAQGWKDWMPKLPSSPGSIQHDAARRMAPATMQLRPSSERASEVRTVRVRVWAAADYRRQTVEWQSRFRRLVDRVNALCRGWPGVRFEVVDIRNWERDSQQPGMGALVGDLAAADPGDDVDLVIGLVAALPVFPGAIENIGMARYLSKHMVMRGLHELTEYDALRRQFDTLTDREREALLAGRKLHKEQVIFLHEWAHTLGVIHNRRPSAIMSPAYDSDQLGFDETEARVIDLALRHRADDGPRWRETTAAELRTIVDKAPDPNWDAPDRKELLAMVTPVRRAAPPNAPAEKAPPPPEPPLGDADRATVNEARALARTERYQEALRKLAPVELHHSRSSEVRLAACELAWHHPPGPARDALAESACHQAAELAPRDPHPQLYLADLYFGAGDNDRARTPLARAEDLLGGVDDTEAWTLLALTLERGRLPTLATRAAVHADPETAAGIGKRASALMRKMALPLDSVSPEMEAEYIRVVEMARATFGSPGEDEAIRAADNQFAGLGDRLRHEAAARHHRRR